ncbi:hypothetical protein [Saccharothrix xinjiangensis]|uniref:Uncharacterized protein n=1 Tax=Saccharothrix xinjiangensis TaxID=204798 RepID=A0ABV9Y6V5_9PSEU
MARPTAAASSDRWTPLVTPEHAADPLVFEVGYVVAMAIALALVLLLTRRGPGLEHRRFLTAPGGRLTW